MTDVSEVQVSYDLAREASDLTTVTVSRGFENGFKVLLHLQGDDAVAFIDAWNGRNTNNRTPTNLRQSMLDAAKDQADCNIRGEGMK